MRITTPTPLGHRVHSSFLHNAGQSTLVSPIPAQEKQQPVTAQALNSLKPLNLVRFAAAKDFTYTPEQNLVFDLKRRAEQNPNGVALKVAKAFLAGPTEHEKKVVSTLKQLYPQINTDALKLTNENSQTEVLTNKELYDSVRRMARALKEQYGVKPGDRVAAIETNTPDFAQLFFATLAVGASIVPINILPLADKAGAKEKLAHMLKVADCKVLFIGKVINSTPEFESLKSLKRLEPLLKPGKRFLLKSALPLLLGSSQLIPCKTDKIRAFQAKLNDLKLMLNSLPPGMKVATPNETFGFSRLLNAKPLDEKDMMFSPPGSDEAVMMFTSGTTSMPKGVRISHKALVHNTEAVKNVALQVLSPEDKQLMILPLFHIFGLSVFLSLMSAGATNVMVPWIKDATQNPQKFLDTIDQEGITILPVIPKMLDVVMKGDNPQEKLKKLKVVISGGEKFPQALYQKFHELQPQGQIWEGYGMTEAGILYINQTGEYGHVGKALGPYIETELKGAGEQGIGEIWIRTPSRGEPYLGTTEDNIKEVFKPDGWLNTGDLGKLDENGNLKIVGRSKEIIKRNGEILSPEDFDIRLKEFLPIRRAFTLSYVPIGMDQEKAVSFVLSDTPGITEAALQEQLEQVVQSGKMARRYVPHYILPLPYKELKDFVPGAVEGKDASYYKGARTYLQRLQQSGVIQFTNKGLVIVKPNEL